MSHSFDFLIIGGGIVGLTTAKELLKRQPKASIAIIEKEHDIATHASGRNSGVLHAGFYYSADSLKAKFTRDGNKAMREYCTEHQIPINDCGKLVVASNEEEVKGLDELKSRGDTNGVPLEWVDNQQMAEIDPNVRSLEKALWSPSTASVNPTQVCKKLEEELTNAGVEIFKDTKYLRKNPNGIHTSGGDFSFGYLINCAGLYADKIAKDFDFCEKYTIMPFKGIYLKYTGDSMQLKTNVYPVPNLKNPFLGVHFTLTVDGHIKIGPTAIPTFWRENYKGVQNFKLDEFMNITTKNAKLFLNNSFNFRSLAFEEMKKYNAKYFKGLASKMVYHMDPDKFNTWTKPGIRSQLIENATDKLVQDFVMENDDRSLHVLNAVSPAFTCSFPIAEHICSRVL